MKKIMLIFCLFFIGCSSGNCRTQKIEAKASGANQGETAMPATSSPQDRIKVYKYDGSLQCGQGKALALAEMAKELKGLEIFSSNSKPDNLMRTMVCGTPTGQANVYEIDKTKLAEAKKRGFKEWTFE